MGRLPARFCIRGHDTEVTGRYRTGNCRVCQMEANRRRVRTAEGKPNKCANGHDAAKAGRYKSGTCRSCQVLYNRNTRRPEGTVSSLPLRKLAHGDRIRAMQVYRVGRGVTKRTAERQAKQLFDNHWIDIFAADVWCISFGYHLCEIFPELYTFEADETEQVAL